MATDNQTERLMESLHSNIMMHSEDWALAKRNIDWYHGCVMGAISAWFSVAINLDIENNLEIRKEYLALITPDYKQNQERAVINIIASLMGGVNKTHGGAYKMNYDLPLKDPINSSLYELASKRGIVVIERPFPEKDMHFGGFLIPLAFPKRRLERT